MREIQASDAKTHLPQLLDAVEHGETLVITRHGRPIARLVPDSDRRQADLRAVIDSIRASRRNAPALSADDLHTLIEDGRKY